MRRKKIKTILQITSVFGIVASTIVATTQRIFDKKDKTMFDIDNFKKYAQNGLGTPKAIGDKFNVYGAEKQMWDLVSREIECEITPPSINWWCNPSRTQKLSTMEPKVAVRLG